MSSVSEFNDICRTCANAGDLHSIYSDLYICYSDMLMAVTGVQILKDDALPNSICVKCIKSLESAYIFRKKAQETDAKLKSFLNNKKIEVFIIVKDGYSDEEHNHGTGISSTSDSENLNNVGKEEVEKIRVTQQCDKTRVYNDLERKEKTITKMECKVSGKVFKRVVRLHAHLREQTKEKLFICELCGVKFSTDASLARHNKTHTDEKLHKCDVCGKEFSQALTLKLHKRNHNREKSHKSVICAKEFDSAMSSVNHRPVHTAEIPSLSHNKKKPVEISEIIVLDNVDPDPPSPLQQNEISFSCDLCKQNFSSLAALKTHYAAHCHKKFLCTYCGQSYTTKTSLDSHLNIHTQPYSCSVCSKSFAHFGWLQTHMRTHIGQPRFVCEFCHKGFTQFHLLQFHIRIHDKLLQCSVCDKETSNNKTLTGAKRMNIGNKPYVCSACNKSLYKSRTMAVFDMRKT